MVVVAGLSHSAPTALDAGGHRPGVFLFLDQNQEES